MDIDVVRVWFDDGNILIKTNTDEVRGHPLSWFPRLQMASKSSLENFTLSPFGIHWVELDEDLSFGGFF